MAPRRRAALGALVLSVALLGGGVAAAAPASALPKQCTKLLATADRYWMWAVTFQSLGDYASYSYYWNLYEHAYANAIASGC